MVSYFICIDWIVFRNFIFINGSCFITKTVYISNRFIILIVCEISYLFIWIDINIIRIFNRIQDRKSTRLNSSHVAISYAVFCLNKKRYTNNLSIYIILII